MTIYTLSIECVFGIYLEERFYRVVEVPSDMTLADLHYYIQKLTGFDDDHLADFYVANSCTGKKIMLTDDDFFDESLVHNYTESSSWNTQLENIYPLPKHKKLYYLFDYGDNWTFEIRRKSKGKPAVSGVDYPRIIHSVGGQPEQYPSYE